MQQQFQLFLAAVAVDMDLSQFIVGVASAKSSIDRNRQVRRLALVR
jgi:hypothetical protein